MPNVKTPIIAGILAAAVAAPAAHAQAPASAGGAAAFGNLGPTGLVVKPGAMLGDPLEITGRAAALAGQRVRIERLDAGTRTWVPVAQASTDADGDFRASWKADRPGDHTLRVVADATAGSAVLASAETAPTARTTIFRRARATWYGPGFWGRTTACGIRLTRSTHGVAHRTWPCGTRVALYLDGRQTEVAVIDRGPFVKGVALDLTQATAQQIGMTGTSDIGWHRRTALKRAARDR